MTPRPVPEIMPEYPDQPKSKQAKTAKASPRKLSMRQGKPNQSSQRRTDSGTHNKRDQPEYDDLKSVVRRYAERETEALAFKTLQLAKQGHKSALDFVYASLSDDAPESASPFALDLGSLTRLDEIADAQRTVIAAATDGKIKPTDAIHYMKMLNELGQAIKNSDLQAEIDELRSYVHGA